MGYRDRGAGGHCRLGGWEGLSEDLRVETCKL